MPILNHIETRAISTTYEGCCIVDRSQWHRKHNYPYLTLLVSKNVNCIILYIIMAEWCKFTKMMISISSSWRVCKSLLSILSYSNSWWSPGYFWGQSSQHSRVPKPTRFHVDIVQFHYTQFDVHSINSSNMICNFPQVLMNVNQVFFKLNQFNCNSQPDLPVHCIVGVRNSRQ